MRHLLRYASASIFVLSIFVLSSASSVPAQFIEAGVVRLEKPIPAPDFTLKALEMRKISFKDLEGKVVLLNFFSPYCPVCQKEASSFDRLDEAIKNKELAILFIASDAKERDLVEFKDKYHISLPILEDENGKIAKAYGVWGHHETFFINRKGKIVGKAFWEKDWTSKNMINFLKYLLSQDK